MGKNTPLDNLVKREGIYYKAFSDKPFSGLVKIKEWSETTENYEIYLIEKGRLQSGRKVGQWVKKKFRFLTVDEDSEGWLIQKKTESYSHQGRLFRTELFHKPSSDKYGNSKEKDGNLHKRQYYKDGKKNGPYEEYFDFHFSLRKCQGNYKEGKKHGKWIWYHPDIEHLHYEGKSEKEIQRQQQELGTIGHYKDDQKHGEWLEFYRRRENDREEQLVEIYSYYHYDKIILHKFYDTDGNLQRKEFYRNGDLISLAYYYTESSEGNFVKEIIEYKNHSKISQSRVCGLIINDEKEGYWEYFYEDPWYDNNKPPDIPGRTFISEYDEKRYEIRLLGGRINIVSKAGNYKNGAKIGVWKHFTKNGKLKLKNRFGIKPDRHIAEYYKNGKLIEKGLLKTDQKEGLWKYYNDRGNNFKRISYRADKKYGSFQEYYSNGQLKETGRYEEDTYIKLTEYSKNGELLYDRKLEIEEESVKNSSMPLISRVKKEMPASLNTVLEKKVPNELLLDLELARNKVGLPIKQFCDLLQVSRQTYYLWLEGKPTRLSNIKKTKKLLKEIDSVIEAKLWPNRLSVTRSNSEKLSQLKYIIERFSDRDKYF